MSAKEFQLAKEAAEKALDILREHFEAVQILASTTDENGVTQILRKGSGNGFARIGMARQYLIEDHAAVSHDRVKEITEQDGE